MSNYVYGFFEVVNSKASVWSKIESVAEIQPLGIMKREISQLYGFPKEHLPMDPSTSIVFDITDSKESWGAEFLLDGRDYAPEADIGLPTLASQRQHLLFSLIESFLSLDEVKKISVAMSQCDQVEEVKFTTLERFREIISGDFDVDAPPNILYIIDTQ